MREDLLRPAKNPPAGAHTGSQVIDGTVVADTRRPVLLFETGLPTRSCIPRVDVRLDLLVPTDHRTGRPYKGTAAFTKAVS